MQARDCIFQQCFDLTWLFPFWPWAKQSKSLQGEHITQISERNGIRSTFRILESPIKGPDGVWLKKCRLNMALGPSSPCRPSIFPLTLYCLSTRLTWLMRTALHLWLSCSAFRCCHIAKDGDIYIPHEPGTFHTVPLNSFMIIIIFCYEKFQHGSSSMTG